MQWERVGMRVGKAGVTRRQKQLHRHLRRRRRAPRRATFRAQSLPHHATDAATRFTNPPSFRDARWTDWLRALRSWKTPPVPANVTELIGFKQPVWNNLNDEPEKLKATHACFFVELPTLPGAARGPRIRFDPVFSHQCGPTSWLGPGRITPSACPVQQLPEVDAIVISHCHYDHLDIPTIKSVVFPSLSPLPSPPGQ
ncbi:hypothetical protein M422DRAFT_257623 [Sphaerobolus stellatus SS14]|uniref:Metallo-beta-lactamase domain-containing protein n=1 Tax=Sphaerobolus stellatus (strain SS14) TaxID=990650 RepID=A0A0C9VDU2_SPHS4|nr:hypothetical protein M422DRAFT_257623 [Sphaerobolus stellatus SS14]